eukprot:TRINITY_DN761_c0_g1_i1.p1 TRINITY_DN761_c0_g1~~TRINITY_DN761_c0_g1_i1.p1  ORF type:complete len:158 (+),score=47.06 TRINITY_DN761_c0_g1_i1:64-537(+)
MFGGDGGNPGGFPPGFPMDGNDPFLRLMAGLGDIGKGINTISSRSSTRSSGGYTAQVDIADHGDYYGLKADLPGVAKDDINLTVHSNEVCLSAARHADADPGAVPFLTRERRMGSFERCWVLPTEILESGVKANFKEGVLTAELVKGKTHQTKINVL